jgi:hypothetical protein
MPKETAVEELSLLDRNSIGYRNRLYGSDGHTVECQPAVGCAHRPVN